MNSSSAIRECRFHTTADETQRSRNQTSNTEARSSGAILKKTLSLTTLTKLKNQSDSCILLRASVVRIFYAYFHQRPQH